MFKHILEFSQGIGLMDVIDIGIIATFFYMSLVWFEKARARFILIGIIILGSIYVIARFLGLYLTTMVLQAFFAIFLIIIVVIFQDELRHIFERIAIWGIGSKRQRKFLFSQDIEILSNALANLSRKEIGALVVIKGSDPLERHIEGGIPLDGMLSQILLESIFDPHAPSHDGAVVVDMGRITKFGCYLPLSMNIKEIGHLGTRHAAALGLAERSDALCILVSEEQGTISVAEGEKIGQISDVTKLNAILEDFYRQRFPKEKRINLFGFLTNNYVEKIIAVILACGLWLVFGHRQEIVRRDFVIPVEYRNLASDMIISEPKPKEVNISLNGSEREFNLVDSKALKLSLDMVNAKEGESDFLLTKDLIRYPASLSLINMEPNKISLKVYKMIYLNVPVKLETKGSSSNGVTIKGMKVEPKELTIIIPSTNKSNKITIATEAVDLKNINKTTTLFPKLITPPDVRFPNDKYPEVKVTIEAVKKEAGN